MLGLSDFRQTRVYQEAFEEGELRGKFKAVPPMLALGLSVEQIAQGLDLDVEQARQAAVSHLLASGMGVEQVAEDLGLDIELVQEGRRQEAEGRREESFYSKLFNLFQLDSYFCQDALVILNPG